MLCPVPQPLRNHPAAPYTLSTGRACSSAAGGRPRALRHRGVAPQYRSVWKRTAYPECLRHRGSRNARRHPAARCSATSPRRPARHREVVAITSASARRRCPNCRDCITAFYQVDENGARVGDARPVPEAVQALGDAGGVAQAMVAGPIVHAGVARALRELQSELRGAAPSRARRRP